MSTSYDWTYKVQMDEPPADTPCACEDCGWAGPFEALADIEECSLTPGDPSPAGRCPDCDALAYVANVSEPNDGHA